MLKRLNIDKGNVTESSKEGPKLYWEHTDTLKTLLYMMTDTKESIKKWQSTETHQIETSKNVESSK